MDGRWFRYKDAVFNLSEVRRFSIDRYKKTQDGHIYTGEIDTDRLKEKPYVLYVDHEPIDHFKTKPEAEKVIENIIRGTYDVK